MISADLEALLRCPGCGGRPAPAAAGLACAGCGARFERRDGYLVAPTPANLVGRETDYQRPEFAATLGYRQVARPWLGAAVRQRWLRRWLFEPPVGPVLEIGCGDGRFLYWNRRRAQVVGLDAVPLFSREALATVDLVQGDARALPFADGAFQAVYSIDVLEHLDSAGLDAFMVEARRVLAPGGRLFIFTNSREPSTFQPVIDAQRHLSAMLRRRAIGDFATDDLRKSDHVKALNTFEDFVLLAARHGFAVRRHRFWNGIAQGFIDNVLIRAGEHLLMGAGCWVLGARGRGTGDGGSYPSPSTQHPTPSTHRQALSRRWPVAVALAALTLAMQADVALLGGFRSGPFFALLERR